LEAEQEEQEGVRKVEVEEVEVREHINQQHFLLLEVKYMQLL
jgi:hypothetical protein